MGLRGPPPCKLLEHDLRAVRLRVKTGWSARAAVIHVAAERGRTLSGLYKAWTRANRKMRGVQQSDPKITTEIENDNRR